MVVEKKENNFLSNTFILYRVVRILLGHLGIIKIGTCFNDDGVISCVHYVCCIKKDRENVFKKIARTFIY